MEEMCGCGCGQQKTSGGGGEEGDGGVRDWENWVSQKRETFGVLFRAPLFLGKWYGVTTYFLYKK